MNTQTLASAVLLIAHKTGRTVVAIEFEDGSGTKFNYQLRDSKKWYYIDLSPELIDNYGSTLPQVVENNQL